MNNSEVSKRIFNSVEDINKAFGTSIKDNIHAPVGCNVICFKVVDLFTLTPNFFYKEEQNRIYYFSSGYWYDEDKPSLEEVVKEDLESLNSTYIYLRLNINPEKDKFTPERLLGVETSKGYIVEVYKHEYTQLGFSLRLSNDKVVIHNPLMIKYCISDDSDTTVSFDEYVDMFYTR